MSKLTKEQIKEAFKKTIERWEKIVEDVNYFKDSECALCLLESVDGRRYECSQSCPIRLYTKKECCHGTPYSEFFQYKTSENALTELNFLRRVYIWWMEDECKEANKEEKKEEWVDVSGELRAEVYERIDGFAINLFHGDLNVAFIDGDGIYVRTESGAYSTYKVKVMEESFQILKKT